MNRTKIWLIARQRGDLGFADASTVQLLYAVGVEGDRERPTQALAILACVGQAGPNPFPENLPFEFGEDAGWRIKLLGLGVCDPEWTSSLPCPTQRLKRISAPAEGRRLMRACGAVVPGVSATRTSSDSSLRRTLALRLFLRRVRGFNSEPTVPIWAVTPASSRHRSRQDGSATPKLGQH